MEHIFEVDDTFPYKTMSFISPVPIAGGNFFIRCFVDSTQKPIYIQPPQCLTKAGMLQLGSKRMYCDILFNHNDEKFVEWIQNIESVCQNKIYDFREKWFESSLEKHDIENSFSQTLKIFKSGKLYSMRVNVPTRLGKCALKVYDENEKDLPISYIKENTSVITILEFQGIKCSSRSFQLEFELKQIMVLNPVDIFEKCIFKQSTMSNSLPERVPLVTCKESDDNQIMDDVDLDVDPIHGLYKKLSITENGPLSNSLGNVDPDSTQLKETEICEIDIALDTLPPNTDIVKLKDRNEVYYKMYQEAKKKAKLARDFAIASYLEAKRIKNTYELDLTEDDDDIDDRFSENF
jgi:hypothetical protein